MSACGGPWIFVVDDDKSMRAAMERILHLGGYTPITYPTAEALLAVSDISMAACLILDVHLPGLNGFELYDQLKHKGTPPPVIFITAYDEPEFGTQAEAAGAAAYFTKPFSGRDLIAAITHAVVAYAESKPRR